MLTCEELRQLKLTEPHRMTAEMEGHLAKCPPCAKFALSVDKVERRLEEAANVPVPDSLVARALRAGAGQPQRRQGSRWRDVFRFRPTFPALAAVSAAVAVLAVSAVLWTQVRESQRLAGDVIVMVRADSAVAPPPGPNAREVAQQVLAGAGVQLASGVREARYIGPCELWGTMGAYITLHTVHGDAKLIVLPAIQARWRASWSDAEFAAVVIPGAKGTAAVVAPSMRTAEDVSRLLM